MLQLHWHFLSCNPSLELCFSNQHLFFALFGVACSKKLTTVFYIIWSYSFQSIASMNVCSILANLFLSQSFYWGCDLFHDFYLLYVFCEYLSFALKLCNKCTSSVAASTYACNKEISLFLLWLHLVVSLKTWCEPESFVIALLFRPLMKRYLSSIHLEKNLTRTALW